MRIIAKLLRFDRRRVQWLALVHNMRREQPQRFLADHLETTMHNIAKINDYRARFNPGWFLARQLNHQALNHVGRFHEMVKMSLGDFAGFVSIIELTTSIPGAPESSARVISFLA